MSDRPSHYEFSISSRGATFKISFPSGDEIEVDNGKLTARHFPKFLSLRGIPLAWSLQQGRPPIPRVTVEIYTKWYELYVVRPNGNVYVLEFDELEDYRGNESAYVDHVPNPHAVLRYADDNEMHVDELAADLLRGRWENEVKDP